MTINPALPLIVFGGLILTAGDIIMKTWVAKNNWSFFVIGFLAYAVGLICLAFSFRHQNIATASLAMVLFNIITLAAVSRFWFHEPLTAWRSVGLLIGLVAVVVLELAG
ncbi:MAG: hypothetical protein PHT12_00585 [Patescibacteria group bacterium]|nr:hypothetical protein [Patescibacteria group bacterium]